MFQREIESLLPIKRTPGENAAMSLRIRVEYAAPTTHKFFRFSYAQRRNRISNKRGIELNLPVDLRFQMIKKINKTVERCENIRSEIARPCISTHHFVIIITNSIIS